MNPSQRQDPEPTGGSTLDFLLLVLIASGPIRLAEATWKKWLWTDWAAAACATVLAACGIHDEFVERQALDWTVRIVFLASSLLVIAATATGLIWVWSRLARRSWSGDGLNENI